jgi:SAM-dependent methyltransferase
VLAAAFARVEWHGCDPNGAAIDWAQANLPDARFAQSPMEPPLPYAGASFDLVYAISIWSHFNEWAARAWLAEMARIVRPGGHLAITVHGLQTVAHHAQLGLRDERELEQIRRGLYRRGFWFVQEFGAEGDHGVVHPEWGNAYMTAEWLLGAVAGEWETLSYAVGRNAFNQDLVLLRRV